MFATAYGVLQQGYCHLVVSSMAVLMFGGMCRYSDVSRLRWRNLQFDNDGNLDVTFDHGGRKNSQFRQGATVTVSAIPHAEVCPVRLLRELQKLVESDQDSFVFRGFNGRLVAKSPGKTTPYVERIKYDQFLRYLSLWFSGVLGISSKDFRKQFGTQSGRSGGASAASNAGVDVELWGQHGSWNSWAAQKCYMEKDRASLLSVTRSIMGFGNANAICAPEPDTSTDIRLESGDIVEITEGDDDVVAEVEGVPVGAFRWS
jgi:hypothetical protein